MAPMNDLPGPDAPSSSAYDRHTLLQMRRLTQRHAALWGERIPELTKIQYAVLRAVGAARDGLTQAEVGRLTVVDKATLAQLVRRLEARGLLVQAIDARDRRRRTLKLTDEGRALARDIAPRAAALDRDTLAPLSPDEHRELVRLLDLLCEGGARGGDVREGR